MSVDDAARSSWQSAVTDTQLPSLEEVRLSSDRVRRRIVLRNAIEYVACALVVPLLTVYAFTLPSMMQRVGAALAVVGTLVVGWQLYRRASPLPIELAGSMPVRDYLRAQLVKQRDALASAFWWYILPFLPGLGILLLGTHLQIKAAGIVNPPWYGWVVGSVIALVCGATWLGNVLVARRIQRRIDELDAWAM